MHLGLTIAIPGAGSTLGEAAPSFDPDSITGLVGWFDADDEASFTFSSGSLVSQWNDKSTAAKHLVQATTGNQPTRSADGGANGRGCVTFTTDDYLQAATYAAALTQPVTMFIVCDTGSTANRIITDGDTVGQRMAFGVNSSDRLLQNAGTSRAVTEVFGTDTTPAVYEVVFNGASSKIYRNGLDCNQTASTIGTGTWGRLRVGLDQSGTLYWSGSVSEILIYDAALSLADRQEISSYLATKYGQRIAIRELTTFTASSDNCVYILPDDYNGHAVIYFHGSGETQLSLAPDPLKRDVMAYLAQLGYVVIAANGGGNNWGNQASIDDYAAALAHVDGIVGVDKVFHLAQSMGGLASLTAIATDAIQCDAWYGIYPVCDLRAMYDSGGSFPGAIRTAYGIAVDGSDYTAKTSGYDPILRPAADFTGARLRFMASTDDTVVSKADHTDAMATLVASTATVTVTTHTGDHGDPSAFVAGDVGDYFQAYT